MSKSIKLEDNTYLDTSSISHKRSSLKGLIDGLLNRVYIEDERMIGGYYVRKWSNGIAEMWKTWYNVSITPQGQEGAVFWASDTATFPNGLFTAPPQVFLNMGCGESQLLWHSMNSITKDKTSWYYVMDTNVTRSNCTVCIYCAGNWK